MKRDKHLKPDYLKQLRSQRVAVIHPNDADGETLVQQLQRIGCNVQAYWPPPDSLADTQLVFCAIGAGEKNLNWTESCKDAAIIAIMNYESPTVLEDMLTIGACGVLSSPLRSTGILAQLVIALGASDELQKLHKRIQRLEKKLASVEQVNNAKLILMHTRGISNSEAYRIIREQAMTKRVTIEEIARAIIHANDILAA